jgi:DNA-binding transcriptional LysR family regulator
VDKLAALRAFVEIADRGSLTRAGEALGRSLPAMVRTLAALEEDLGTVLLRRTTRSMSLTEEGRIYLERSRAILADLAEADALVGSGHGEPRGLLRVTAPVLFGRRHVASEVLGFLREYPAVQVELLLLDRMVDLVEEGIDVGLRIGPLADSSMIAVSVGEMRRVICASPALLRGVGEPGRPQDLAELPCVRVMGTAPGPVWRFDEGGREIAVRGSGPFVTNQVAAAVDACIAGMGFGSFFSYQVEPAVRDGRLRVVLRDFERPPVPVSLAYPGARVVTSRLRAFLDWMKPRLRARPELE